jgi:hypothetical protein
LVFLIEGDVNMSRYAMLSDQSLRDFRAWLDRMPAPTFDRRRGAFDTAMPEEAASPPRYYNRAAARRLLQFLATKLNPADLAEAWRMIQAKLDPNEAPRRRNGHAA